MAADPKVSVVIGTRNRRASLAEAVDSVRIQHGVRWELIVVDDASCDDTWAYLSGLRAADDTTTLRQASHGERSCARNRGLDEARGRYVMFLDDDDTLHKDALVTLANALDKHANVVAAIGAREDWFPNQGYRRRDVHPWRTKVRDCFDDMLFGYCPCTGQNLFRTDVIRSVGGFCPGLDQGEDRDLWLRVARRGPVVFCPQTTVTYRIRPEKVRPADVRWRREKVARRAIRALPRSEWRHAVRLRRCTAFFDAAQDEVNYGRPYLAAVEIAKAVHLAPSFVLSPLIATWIARRLLGRLYHRYLGHQPP